MARRSSLECFGCYYCNPPYQRGIIKLRFLEAGEPDAQEQGDDYQPQGHFTQAGNFFERLRHLFFIAGIQVEVRDLNSQ